MILISHPSYSVSSTFALVLSHSNLFWKKMIKPSECRKQCLLNTLNDQVIRTLKTASVFKFATTNSERAEAKTGQRWQRVTTFAASLTSLHADLERMISQNMHRLPAESFMLSMHWTFATEKSKLNNIDTNIILLDARTVLNATFVRIYANRYFENQWQKKGTHLYLFLNRCHVCWNG